MHFLQTADAIRHHIEAQTGYVVSIGVATNKLLAKLASKRAKPAGTFILTPSAAAEMLETLPVREIPGRGGQIADRLESELHLKTAKECQALTAAQLVSLFGPRLGYVLFDEFRGIDNSPVVVTGPPKSVQTQCGLTPLVLSHYNFADRAGSTAGSGMAATIGDENQRSNDDEDGGRAVGDGGDHYAVHQLVDGAGSSLSSNAMTTSSSSSTGTSQSRPLMYPAPPWALHRIKDVFAILANDMVDRLEDDYEEYHRHPGSLVLTTQLYTCTPADVGGLGARMPPTAATTSSSSSTAAQAEQYFEGGVVRWPDVAPSQRLVKADNALLAAISSSSSSSSSAGVPTITWTKPASELTRRAGQTTSRSLPFPSPAASSALSHDQRVAALMTSVQKLYGQAAVAAAKADGWDWNGVMTMATGAAAQVAAASLHFKTPAKLSEEETARGAVDLGAAAPAAAADTSRSGGVDSHRRWDPSRGVVVDSLNEAAAADGRRIDWMGHPLGAAAAAAAGSHSDDASSALLNRFTLPLATVKLALAATNFRTGPPPAGLGAFLVGAQQHPKRQKMQQSTAATASAAAAAMPSFSTSAAAGAHNTAAESNVENMYPDDNGEDADVAIEISDNADDEDGVDGNGEGGGARGAAVVVGIQPPLPAATESIEMKRIPSEQSVSDHYVVLDQQQRVGGKRQVLHLELIMPPATGAIATSAATEGGGAGASTDSRRPPNQSPIPNTPLSILMGSDDDYGRGDAAGAADEKLAAAAYAQTAHASLAQPVSPDVVIADDDDDDGNQSSGDKEHLQGVNVDGAGVAADQEGAAAQTAVATLHAQPPVPGIPIITEDELAAAIAGSASGRNRAGRPQIDLLALLLLDADRGGSLLKSNAPIVQAIRRRVGI